MSLLKEYIVNYRLRKASRDGNIDQFHELAGETCARVDARGWRTGQNCLHNAVLSNNPLMVDTVLSYAGPHAARDNKPVLDVYDTLFNTQDANHKKPLDLAFRLMDESTIVRPTLHRMMDLEDIFCDMTRVSSSQYSVLNRACPSSKPPKP